MANELMAGQNEIVIYQPDDTMRLEVKLVDDSVWLSQEQMIELFQRDRSVISRHIRNAFQEGEVDEANSLHFLQTNQNCLRIGAARSLPWSSTRQTRVIGMRMPTVGA